MKIYTAKGCNIDIDEIEKPSYIVAKNGFFIAKENKIFKSCVQVKSIPEFSDQQSKLVMKIGKIPYHIIEDSLKFFRAVFNKYASEASLFITHNEEDKTWGILVPKQEVSACGVDYETGVMDGRKDIYGTIHSHCNMSAFHSGTDDKDENNFDGIHLTLGEISSNDFEIAASVTSNSTRFKFEPEDIIEGIIKKEKEIGEHKWIDLVTKKNSINKVGGSKIPEFNTFDLNNSDSWEEYKNKRDRRLKNQKTEKDNVWEEDKFGENKFGENILEDDFEEDRFQKICHDLDLLEDDGLCDEATIEDIKSLLSEAESEGGEGENEGEYEDIEYENEQREIAEYEKSKCEANSKPLIGGGPPKRFFNK